MDGNDRKFRLYDIETATFSNINFTAGAQQPDTLGMEYTPFGGLLFTTVGFPPAGDCIKQVRLLTAANGPAGALLAESTFKTCGVVGIESLTTQPDGRIWALDFWDGRGVNTLYKTVESFTFTATTPPAPIPPPFGSAIRWLAWAPDGFGRAYVEVQNGTTVLTTASRGDFNPRSTPLAGFGPRTTADIAWSSEGSEVAFFFQSGQGIINSIRRDRRDVADRNQKVLWQVGGGSLFLWKLSWRW